MAESSSQEKTEEATPRRLREARKKGQVPKSKDISQIFVMIVVFAIFAMTINYMGGEFKKYFQLCFDSLKQSEITGSLMWDLGKAGLFTLMKGLMPMFVAGVITATLVGMAQVGALFTGEPLKPKFEKLNPIEGFKNMFKVVTFIELIKNVIKLAVVLYLAYSTIYKSLDAVISSSRVNILYAAKMTGDMIFEFLVKVCLVFVLISLFDYVIQRWNFMKNMRMTKDEVKREYKQDEGDPAIKGERRRLHREMAFGDAKRAVKKADAVVTNPIHVACVIEYDQTEMSAPQLTLKGQRQFAEMIVKLAREEEVPIIRNIPLAWALLNLEIGDEVPEDLYEAVAEVLTIVYDMKNEQESASANVAQSEYVTPKNPSGSDDDFML